MRRSETRHRPCLIIQTPKSDFTFNRVGQGSPVGAPSAAVWTHLCKRGQEGNHTVRYSATHVEEKAANLRSGRGHSYGIFIGGAQIC